MKIKRMGLVAAVGLATIVASSGLALGQDAKESKKGRGGASVEERVNSMATELKLTDDQKTKVKAVLEDGQKKRQALRDLSQDERREKGRALMEEQDKKLKEILTADQYKKWQEIRPARGNRGGGDGGEKKKEKN